VDIRVIGVGNLWRGDDGVGPAAVAYFEGRRAGGARTMTAPAEATALMAAFDGADAAIIIDAAAPVGAPGRITRLDANEGTLPTDEDSPSTHGFGVAAALALAEALKTRPPTLLVYAVEGADFGQGEGLSPPVAAAIPLLVDRVVEEIAAIKNRECAHA